MLLCGLVVLAVTVAVQAEPAACPAAAFAHGDDAAAAELSELLAERGIAKAAPSGCRALDVQIRSQGRRLRLAMTDPYGRVAVRTVRDLSTAATLVESWTRQALATEVTLAAAREEATPTEPLALAAAPTAGELVELKAASPPHWALTVAQETSVGTDGSLWLGGGLGACRILGWGCVGFWARAAADSSGALARRDVAGLLAADRSRGRGSWGLRAGLAAGVGYSQNELRNDLHGIQTEDGADLRLRAQLTASRALSSWVALDATVAFESALLGRAAVMQAHVTDPGPAGTFLRLGLALRFGGLGWER